MSEKQCSECGVSAADCALEYGMCPLCANSEWDSETLTLRPRRSVDAEITALRAALDQERADNARLRSIAHAADVFVRVEDSTARTMREWQLAFDLLRTALLSGRGEVNDE